MVVAYSGVALHMLAYFKLAGCEWQVPAARVPSPHWRHHMTSKAEADSCTCLVQLLHHNQASATIP
jgi:hypothetical protein